MKDNERKLEDIEAPTKLVGASYILFRYIDLAEGGKSLAEVAKTEEPICMCVRGV